LKHPKIDVNKGFGIYGSPIFTAITLELPSRNSKEITKLLIAHPGIDLTKSIDNDNVLHFLVSFPKDVLEDVLKKLQSKGQLAPLINAKNDEGDTPLHTLVNTNDPIENIEVLLKYGVNINAQNKNGLTPLMLTTYTKLAQMYREDGEIEKAKKLLEDSKEKAKILLGNGARLDIKNNKNQTALDMCKEQKCEFEDALTYQGGRRSDKKVKTWWFHKGTHPYVALRRLFGKTAQVEKIIEKIEKGDVSARNGPKCKIDGKLSNIDLISVKKGNTTVHTVQLWGTCYKRKSSRYGIAGKITVKN